MTVSTPVIISATYQGVTRQVQLVVNIATPSSVALSAPSIRGGATLPSNTVRMDGPAPSGGLTISLSSSNPGIAAVPATVTVLPGSQNSKPFVVNTNPVTIAKVVTISATYHGVTKFTTLTITP